MTTDSPIADEVQCQVAVAGEALIDLIARNDGLFEACAGGAVFNLARAIARQDIATAYLNPLSADGFGRLLAQTLEGDRVFLPQSQGRTEPSSLAVVRVDSEGQPNYAFYREQVADRATSAAALIDSCRRQSALQIVCTGGLALLPEDGQVYQPWLEAQHEAGQLVVIDANLRPAASNDLTAYRASVLRSLRHADLVKVSDEDLAYLRITGRNPLERARHLFDHTGATLIALTLGEQGAWLLHADGHCWHAWAKAALPVVDSVGAGDCFLGGLVTALIALAASVGNEPRTVPPHARMLAALDERSAGAILAHAVASASCCVQQRGCVPPTAADVKRLLSGGLIETASH